MVCLMKISALFLPYLPRFQGKSGSRNYLISHWPVSTGLSYSKCWLFCKFIQYMLVWSWMQAQSLAQDTTLSTRFQLPNVSTGISHAHLKLRCPKQDSWSSPQILLLPSFLHLQTWHRPSPGTQARNLVVSFDTSLLFCIQTITNTCSLAQ